MFWAETITENHKYCVCQAAWNFMKIANINAYKNLLEIYITPEDGNRCCVYKQKKGSYVQQLFEFKFHSWEHVKIEVIGGEITLYGYSDEEGTRHKATNHFTSGCPFGDETDWSRPEKLLSKTTEILK